MNIANKLHGIKRIGILLLVLFLFSFTLRFWYLPEKLFFGPEQGIDFLVIKELVLDHKLTLIGSKTDIPGIFHGPIYYYVSVIPFVISHGNPLISSAFFIVINSATVFFVYLLGLRFRNQRTGIVAALIFAVSFNAIVYARWLSNPPLSIPLAALSMVFLYDFIKGKTRSLLGYSLCFGLLSQAEFLNLLFYSVFSLTMIGVFFQRFKKTSFLFLLANLFLAAIVSVGSYILFDLRHEFLITKNILELVSGKTGFHVSFTESLSSNLSAFLSAYSSSIFPHTLWVGLVILLGSVIVLGKNSLKKKADVLLLLWLFVPILLLLILRHAVLDQYFVSLVPAFILVTALLIDSVWSKSKVLGMILLMGVGLSNLIFWSTNIPYNKHVFFQSAQPDLRYTDQLATIDSIYHDSNGKAFSFQAYTIPYWEQQGWQYLFWSYGQRHYGYPPVQEAKTTNLFVIIQDDPSNVAYQQDWLKNTVSKWGKVTKTFKHGIVTTEELEVEK